MTAEEISEHVDAMIDKTFQKLNNIYKNNQEGKNNTVPASEEACRLIFPHYTPKDKENKGPRISEQELRFAFTETFIQYCNCKNHHPEVKDWHYSVETPTNKKYIFTEKDGNSNIPRQDDKGQSARFDFVIHDKDLKRICLIEFKALNPDQNDYHKDFEKLIHDMEDDSIVRYFIQVLKSHNNGTSENIAKKLKGITDKNGNTDNRYKGYFLRTTPKIEYRCYELENGEFRTDNVINKLKDLK